VATWQEESNCDNCDIKYSKNGLTDNNFAIPLLKVVWRVYTPSMPVAQLMLLRQVHLEQLLPCSNHSLYCQVQQLAATITLWHQRDYLTLTNLYNNNTYVRFIHTCAGVNPHLEANPLQSVSDVKHNILLRWMVTDKCVICCWVCII